jgi:hypothetical protein
MARDRKHSQEIAHPLAYDNIDLVYREHDLLHLALDKSNGCQVVE